MITTKVVLYGKTYRAVVVHSSAHDQRRQKRIDRQLEKDRHALEAKCPQMGKGGKIFMNSYIRQLLFAAGLKYRMENWP